MSPNLIEKRVKKRMAEIRASVRRQHMDRVRALPEAKADRILSGFQAGQPISDIAAACEVDCVLVCLVVTYYSLPSRIYFGSVAAWRRAKADRRKPRKSP